MSALLILTGESPFGSSTGSVPKEATIFAASFEAVALEPSSSTTLAFSSEASLAEASRAAVSSATLEDDAAASTLRDSSSAEVPTVIFSTVVRRSSRSAVRPASEAAAWTSCSSMVMLVLRKLATLAEGTTASSTSSSTSSSDSSTTSGTAAGSMTSTPRAATASRLSARLSMNRSTASPASRRSLMMRALKAGASSVPSFMISS